MSEVTALYVVMAVALVVWLGIFLYLWALDRRVRRLEREVVKRTTRAPGAQ